ncbi:MAG: diaminopimelate epimerase [Pseudomonadota bacterium]|nr:diaminopimelate epimerase [Pseudomonadota bacterium]
MKLKFSKMQGAGNDFVVLDGINQDIALTPAQYQALADRHFGIGCDQILLVQPATRPDCDFRYRIFNGDGGEVQQCGNGARCFVRFVSEQGLTAKREIRVETAAGVIVPRLEDDGQVTVDMGPPRFEPSEIPFCNAGVSPALPTYVIDVDGEPIELSVLSMGNPHAVRIVCNVDSAPVQELGAKIEHHPSFPERVNVGFMQVIHRRAIKLRVFERGAGETLACGTGACAAVVAGISRGLLDAGVQVHTRGGDLSIRWAGIGHHVFLTGPAVTVFQGEIAL